MKIVSADITGSLIVNGVDVTTNVVSSSIFSGSIAGRVTSLEQFSASLDATFATDASVSASILVLSQSVQASQAALSSSYALTSGSYAASSASLSTRVTNLETTSSVVSSSFAVASGSLSTRVTNLETTSSVVSSSFATTSGSLSGRVTIIEGQDATTGSNTFTGPQYVSQASNAISFTSTASLYTDGGLRVAKDSFVSGTAYFNNITVYGTSSIQYITSSQVNIGSNIITVNTDTPAVRFGGLSVFDSGSTQLTGSIFWDSEKNHWIYSNPSGSSYNSAMLMNGPRNTGSLGDEQGTTFNALMKGQGGDHITSSQLIDDGTTVRIPGNLQVTGSTILSSALTGTSATFTGSLNVSGSFIVTTTAPELQVGATGVTLGNVLTDIHQATGSLRVTGSSTSYFLGGNVGIGNTSPAVRLQVSGTIATGDDNNGWGRLSFDTATNATRLQSSKNGTDSVGLSFWTQASGGGFAERMAISGSNVGIGTSSPRTRLQVTPQSNAEVPVLGTANGIATFTSANTNYGLQFNSTSDGSFHIQSQRFDNISTAYSLILNVAGGNVGIGTSSPSVVFNVSDPDHGIGIAYRGSSALPSIAGLFTDTGVSGGTGYGDLLVKARTDFGGFYGINFYTSATNNTPVLRMRVQSDGVLSLLSGQLKFPATQIPSSDPNTLDDYEEGTYTPDIRLGSWTFGARSGFYTRIGNLVTVNLLLVWTANNAPSGDPFQITMPFSAFGSGNLRAPATIGYAAGINFDTSRQLVSHIDMSDNYVSFRQLISGGTPSTLTTANMNNSGEIQISVTYQV
jgi:hypothetical protein